MKSLIILFGLIASMASSEYYPKYKENYVYLQDIYALNSDPQILSREAVAIIQGNKLKKTTNLKGSVHIDERKTPANCTYPLEVVILQDVTGSFTDDMPIMANNELPIMYNTLTETHPGSTFGIVSFADKPLMPFGYPPEDGYRDDYCYLLDEPLGQDLTSLSNVYKNYLASGGADPPENQYGAILNAIQAKKIGWGSTPDSIRLLVVVTDSPPHYDDDNNNGNVDRHGMSKFSGVFDEENINDQCVQEFYPSWQETIAQINAPTDGGLPPYVAFLIYDDGAKNKTLDTWEWVASQIFEDGSFVRERAADSSNFWEELSQIIGIMDSVECAPLSSTTTLPPTTTTGTTTTGTTTTRPPTSTTTATTGTTTSSEHVTTDDHPCPPCPPCPGPDPCHPCEHRCGNVAYLKYPKDAKQVDVHIGY